MAPQHRMEPSNEGERITYVAVPVGCWGAIHYPVLPMHPVSQ
jgi:hypothetical protein